MTHPDLKPTAPRIYVACLAAYNNGLLHGAWIDSNQSADAIRREIATMLKASPMSGAEEYAIHDYEAFGGIRIEEYTGIDEVAALAAFVAAHGALGAEVYNHYGDLDEALQALEERYCGVFESVAAFMEQHASDTSDVPQHIQYYIDWERMARDAELSGDIFTLQTAWNEVHVFWAQ